MILAIDPGNKESAYVKIDEKTLKPMEFGKIENTWLIPKLVLDTEFTKDVKHLAIEMIASYGMAVGKEVFETCVWIGRIEQVFFCKDVLRCFIYRKDEKINLCGTMKAKDSNIIQALKDRFGNKGTKANKGWFYGFSKDVWQAYAVGVTYHDMYLKGEEE
jgi:hypothetical protein